MTQVGRSCRFSRTMSARLVSLTGQSLLDFSCSGADQVEEEVVVPRGALELAAHGVLCRFSPCDVEGEASQHGEVFGSVFFAVALAILVHGHIQHPVQAVFDGPMGAHGVLEAFGRERRAHDVVAGFGCRASGGFAPRLDLAEGGQPRPVMALPQPCDLVADSGAARLDAPVIAVNLLT